MMSTRQKTAFVLVSLAALCAAGSASAGNLIDATHGAGVGSFEVGSFAPIGTGNFNFQSLRAGATTITGWLVGGVGVDWLSTPNYGASDGLHAVDLGYYDAGAGSLAISVPTVIGATYDLTFDAAAVPGFPEAAATTISAGGRFSHALLTIPRLARARPCMFIAARSIVTTRQWRGVLATGR